MVRNFEVMSDNLERFEDQSSLSLYINPIVLFIYFSLLP